MFSDWSLQDRLHAWRWDFDPAAQHIESFTRLFAELARWPPDGTAAEWQARWRSLDGRLTTYNSYLGSFAVELAQGRTWSRARVLTRIGMLRIGLAVRLGERLPDLLDPFDDGPLRVDDLGSTVVVHSRAPGVDASRWTRP